MYIQNLIASSGPKNFGWVPHAVRTPEQNKLNFDMIGAMPQFKLKGTGYYNTSGGQSQIWDCVRKLNSGANLKALYQQIGSCVGHGLCNAEWYLMFVQNIIKGKRETPVLPYEPYGYAQSRVCAGISGNSDGSTGTGAADASKLYGILDSRIDGLPAFKDEAETITFSGNTDKSWGNRGAPSQYLTEGKKHLVKTVSLIRNSDDAIAALYNNYPLTLASDWGGKMMPDLKEGVLLNPHADTWNHQMSCTNVWDHPILKMIFYIQNSWSATAHGRGPNGEPLGGFWILRKDMDYIIAQQEVFAFSDEDGFPERRIDKSLLMLI
jgi:hypothetical protein